MHESFNEEAILLCLAEVIRLNSIFFFATLDHLALRQHYFTKSKMTVHHFPTSFSMSKNRDVTTAI